MMVPSKFNMAGTITVGGVSLDASNVTFGVNVKFALNGTAAANTLTGQLMPTLSPARLV